MRAIRFLVNEIIIFYQKLKIIPEKIESAIWADAPGLESSS